MDGNSPLLKTSTENEAIEVVKPFYAFTNTYGCLPVCQKSN